MATLERSTGREAILTTLGLKRLGTSGSLLLVVLLGVLDYLTGDYSLLPFYLFPVAIASWLAGRIRGLVIALACGAARFISDHAVHGSLPESAFHYQTYADEMFLFVAVALVVPLLPKALARRD